MSILDGVQDEVERRGYGGVAAIHIRVGRLSGVVPEALESAFGLAAEQTSFAACRLIIEEIPVVVFCPNCRSEQPVHSEQWFCCSVCNAPATEVVSGRELEISALELAT